MRQQIGSLIDSRGVTACLHEGDMITDVIVITKIVTADGGVGVQMETSEGCDWLVQLGLMTAAWQVMRAESPIRREDDD